MNTSAKEPILKPWIKEYLIPIGLILIAALALPAQYERIPAWVIIILVSYLVIAAAVSLYAPVIRLLSFVKGKWRLRRFAKTCFPQLLEDAKKFRQLTARQNRNTLLYVLQQAALCDEQKGKSLLPDPEYIETIETWLLSIEKRIDRHKPGDFPGLCKEMSDLILSYNRFCSRRLRKLEELMGSGGLPEQRLRQLKQQWNVQGDEHMTFVREWEIFARRINEKIGSRICFDYYEQVGTLE